MEKTLDLSIGFKGQLKLNAQAVPLQEGYLKLGGYVASTETNGLAFGIVASAATTDLDAFKAGAPESSVVRGIVVFDDAIAQNAPAHSGKYLCGLPAAVLNHGFLWISAWTKTASHTSGETTVVDAIDPAVGCKVIFNNTTGAIEFVAGNTDVPTGWTALSGASVRSIDADNGALVYLD